MHRHQQVVMNGSNGTNGVHHEEPKVPPGIDLEGFRWTSVDEKFNRLSGHHEAARVLAENPSAAALVSESIAQLPPLGPIANFKGTFTGKGLNTIFRPANTDTLSSTQFLLKPKGPAPPTPPSDNVLEINLTEETLSFSAPLGKVPNRGFGTQKDIALNGVAYIQAVNDVTNTATGKADAPPSNIHLEPGTWMHVPSSTDPVLQATLVRMASIPHGTTINAQCVSPTTKITGKPDFTAAFNIVSIQPFPIGTKQGPTNPVPPFPSQTASDPQTFRLPQDLSRFIAEGTITQAIIDNPNSVLGEAIATQNIKDFTVFRVSTLPDGQPKPVAGGGTASIDFLAGDNAADGPNANAISMNATFWIETVVEELHVPPFPPGRPQAMEVHPTSTSSGTPRPTFLLHPPPNFHVTGPRTITAEWTQIQYSQVVLLNFGGLSWPHVSVATLVPASPIPLSLPGVPTSA